MNALAKVICYIFSNSPIATVSMDNNYHHFSWKESLTLDDLRFSIASFGLGAKKIYIGTYKKNSGFEFCKCLKLIDASPFPENQKIEVEANKYVNELKEYADLKLLDSDRAYLQYKIEEANGTKNNALSKANNYTAILLVLVPVFFTSGIQLVTKSKSIFMIVVAVGILYCLINIAGLIFDMYKVRGFTRSVFSDIRKRDDKEVATNEAYFVDWYAKSKENPYYVSVVLNIERYLIVCMILVVMFSSMHWIGFDKVVINESNVANTSSPKEACNIIFWENGKDDAANIKKMLFFLHHIGKSDIKIIIIKSEKKESSSLNGKYATVKEILQSAVSSNTSIIEVTDEKNNHFLQGNELFEIVIFGGK